MGHPILFLGNGLGEVAGNGPLPGVLFYVFAAATVGAGICVALARNIVRAAVGLMFALAGMSGLYLLLNAEFIAAVQLVVYVGGTLILIVFGVMLTSKSPSTTYSPKRFEVVWALVVTAMVVAPLFALLASSKFPHAVAKSTTGLAAATQNDASATSGTAGARQDGTGAVTHGSDAHGVETVGLGDKVTGAVGEQYPMKALGKALLEPGGYLVPFELVSVLLLAVMIGAAYLAKGRKPRTSGEGAGA